MNTVHAKQNMVPLKELNLTNRFLFDEVMEDPVTQQEILSIIFGRDVPLLNHNESEKEIRLSPLIRSIRMDGTVRIFLNTRGENEEEVSAELVELLHYVEQTTDKNAEMAESERIRRIHKRVRKVKSSEEVGVKYMQAWEERYYDKQEAREEGRAEGLAEGRIEGIKAVIETCRELGVSKETVMEKVLQKFEVTREEAEQLLDQNW